MDFSQDNGQFGFGNTQADPSQMSFPNMSQMNAVPQPVSEQMPNMGQLNEPLQPLPSAQPIEQTYNDSGNQFDMNQMNGQPQGMQNMDQMNIQLQTVQNQTGLNFQEIPDQNFQFDPVGDYVNVLNADTQELAQCNNMLKAIADNPLFANAETIRIVASAAHAVVNRVRQRELEDSANQIILNALGADPRYETAAQAFSAQLKLLKDKLDSLPNNGNKRREEQE